MKQFVCSMVMTWWFVSLHAQTNLCLSTDKTSSLIFPFAIRHVDRGTQSLLVQTVKDVPTILLVKAATKDFPETNLSVITDDGSVFSFAVCYDERPAVWVHHLPTSKNATVSTYANSILDNPQTMRGIEDAKWDVLAKINGIYIRGDVIYYQLHFANESPVDFDVELFKFYIRDKKRNKKTAIQENELKPLYVAGNISEIKAYGTLAAVVALDKFTLSDAKYLAVELMEKNGGRHLSMKVGNKKIMQAITLPDLK